MSNEPLKVIVVGEGRGERGKRVKLKPFTPIGDDQQGALEILVRRALHQHVWNKGDWHAGIADGVTVLERPVIRGEPRVGIIEILQDENLLAMLVLSCFEQARQPTGVQLVVVQYDKEDARAFEKAVKSVREKLTSSTLVATMLPHPELEAWLASKRGMEKHLSLVACTGPHPNEEELQKDAKAELVRMAKAANIKCGSLCHRTSSPAWLAICLLKNWERARGRTGPTE